MKKIKIYRFGKVFIFCFFLAEFVSGQDTLACEDINKLTNAAIEAGNFEEAFLWMEKASEVCNCQNGKQGKDFIASTYLAGLYYQYTGDLNSADTEFEKGLKCLEETGISDIGLNARLISGKSNVLLELGDFSKAEVNQIKALSIVKDSLGNKDMLYGECNNTLGVIYSYQSEFFKADSVFQIALKIAEHHSEKEGFLELNVLTNMAGLYEAEDNYEKALPVYHKLIPMFETQPDEFREIFYNNYAILLAKTGMYKEAIEVQKKSLLLSEKTKGRKTYSFCTGLLNLAEIYDMDNQESLRDSIFQFLPELTIISVGKDHQLFGNVLSNYAVYALAQNKYALADSLIHQALLFYEKHEGLYREHGIAISTLANLNMKLGNIHTADSLFKVSLDILSKIIEKKSYFYATSLADFARMYDKIGEFEKAWPFYEEADRYLHENIRQHFLILSESRQEIFFKRFDRYFGALWSYCLKGGETIPSASSIAFNDVLLLKQFRLENGKNMRRVLAKESGNALAQKYNIWLEKRRIIAREAALPKQFRLYDIDSLQIVIENLEAELSLNNSFQEKQRVISWQDVLSGLRPNEAAIEFYHFRFQSAVDTDSILYCALLLRPGFDYPKLIYLFEERQLESILRHNTEDSEQYVSLVYRNPILFQLIWQPLDSLLDGVTKIYYSPSGLLHRVSISAIAEQADGPLISDHYDLQCLSSTRELVVGNKNLYGKDMETALVFGGIRYETDSLKMVRARPNIAKDFKNWSPDSIALRKAERAWADSIWQWFAVSFVYGSEARSNPKFLPGSLHEMVKAKRILNSKGVVTITLSEYEALEESFKMLGEFFPSPHVIHISTHGFFFPDPIREKEDAYKPATFADNPLFRSGLHFAGSINAWQKKSLLAGFEDGILYAYEIADMDLSNTKLVVLSACETGLGDIAGGEGVYGLQRAFKLAGAQHIIMSLWKISDAATVDFMESFYRNWLSGETDIREAFARARQEMRLKYKDPYYWAAFVLI